MAFVAVLLVAVIVIILGTIADRRRPPRVKWSSANDLYPRIMKARVQEEARRYWEANNRRRHAR